MKTLLLTGASGFIGSYLLDTLMKMGTFKIIVLKRSTTNTFRIDTHLDSVCVYNIDEVELETIFMENSIDGVLHLASFYVKSHLQEDVERMIDSNVKFPTMLLEYCQKYNVDFFINTGTFFEYNCFSNPITETSKLQPYNLYASTKSAFDAVLKYYAESSKLDIVTLKLSAPFGYNDNHKLIQYLIDAILNNKELALEKGEQEWDFIYVKDVVSAFVKAIELCLNAKRTLHEDILIGTGTSTSIKEIVEILHELSGTQCIRLEKDYPSKQIFLSKIDNTRALNLLQWLPRYTIKDALAETYELYKENGI